MALLNWLAARLQEPSTYSGLAALMASMHLSTDPGLVHDVTLVCTGAGGFLGFILSERKKA